MAELFPHKFTLDSKQYVVLLPDVYEGIGQAVGLSKVGATESIDDAIRIGLADGLRYGQLFRLRVTYRGTTGKSKSARIVCPADKAKTAIGTLIGKSYSGSTIRGAGVPRRRRLG